MPDCRIRQPKILDWYMQQAQRYPLLTPAQEISLATDVQRWVTDENPSPAVVRRGRRAFNKFFNCNLRLLAKVSNKWIMVCAHLEADDLVQEGAIGLSRGIMKFDPTRGYKFSTYAWFWVNQSMSRAVAYYDRLIRLPTACSTALRRARNFAPGFMAEHGRMPTIAECAAHAEVSEKNMAMYFRHYEVPISLDVPVKAIAQSSKSKGVENMIHLVECEGHTPEQALNHGIELDGLETALSNLTPDHLKVIKLLYGFNGTKPLSLRATCTKLKMPQKRIEELDQEAREYIQAHGEVLGLCVA